MNLEKDETEYILNPETTRQYYQARFSGFVIYVKTLPNGKWGWHINQQGLVTHNHKDYEDSKEAAYLKALEAIQIELSYNFEKVSNEILTLQKEDSNA